MKEMGKGRVCPVCKGDGVKKSAAGIYPKTFNARVNSCPKCGGKGVIPADRAGRPGKASNDGKVLGRLVTT